MRALDRQIGTLFYECLLGSQDKAKAGVALEAATNIAADAPAEPREFIRDPYVLEFLGATASPALYEKDLEQGLLSQLQQFLMEIGKKLCVCANANSRTKM